MRVVFTSCLTAFALSAVLLTTSLQATPMLPAGDSTIVAFGDSTTAIRPGSIANVYADLLRTELPADGITGSVLNKGVGGNNTNHATSRFSTDVLANNPDLVVMQFGINDSAWNVWENPPATAPRVALSTYISNMTSMTQQLKAAGSQVILMTPNAMRWTPALLNLYGVPPYDPNDPMGFNNTMLPYCQAVRDLAAAESVPLVDVYNMFVDYDAVSGQSMDNLLLDGMHPNGAGHRMIADALIETITGNGVTPPPTNLPSADFAYKYEATTDLPTVEDSGAGKTNWDKAVVRVPDNFAVNTGAGTLNYNSASVDPTKTLGDGGEWFASSNETTDSAWVANVSAGTSYTVEFSVKVNDSGATGTGLTPGAAGFHAVVDNGDERLWVNVATDHVAIGEGNLEARVLQGNVDNSSDFHDYRIAFDGVRQRYNVWRDGILIGKDIDSEYVSSKNDVGFGDMSSTSWADAELDHFRWDPTNNYEPMALDPVVLSEKGSDDFGYKYEANSDLPSVEDSGAGKTNWAFFDYTSIPFDANFQVADGKLSYSTTGYYPDPGYGGEWFFSDTTVADSAWAEQIYGGNSFTAEFSAKVTGGEGATPGLHTSFENGIEGIWLTVDTDHIAIGDGFGEDAILLDGVDNFSDFHTYRIAFDAVSRKFQVWRDGEHIGVDLDAAYETLLRRLSFGDGTSSGFGDAEIDFFRWDATGAYAPESLTLIPGDFNGDGSVDVSDLGILATNYGGTEGMELIDGDADGDGDVDVSDLGILATNYGTTSVAAVPEPSVLIGLLGLVLAGCCTRRRR